MDSAYPDHDGFEAGEDVMFTPPGTHGERRGTVRKVSAARLTIEALGNDGQTVVLHRCRYGAPYRCRRVTERDRVRWQWQADTRAWEEARPTTRLVYLVRWSRGGDYRVDVERVNATLDTLREIADEAEMLREWLRKQPAEPR